MKNGFAIPVAWPDTYCKQPSAWYDGLMNYLGFSKNHYYKVGHAALVLVHKNGECFYFDFGRYHAPWGFGRVRDKITDHDLQIKTKAIISNFTITNFEEILTELRNNKSCHGTGRIVGSYVSINFEKALDTAKKMQDLSPYLYGPFVRKGTNCSRFVRSVILASELTFINWLFLTFPWSITPTPMTNINCFYPKIQID